MILNGNKLVTALFVTIATSIAHADTVPAPELVTFTAGTPAKAAEVNANFGGLKTYGSALNEIVTTQAALIEALENKVTALENEGSNTNDEFIIPVKGDDLVIGYTNRIPTLNDSTILIKTKFGLAIIDNTEDGNYVIKGYNEAKSELSENQIYFTDAQCLNAHVLTSGGEYGKSFTFTKNGSPANGNLIVTSSGDKTSYLLSKNAQIDTTTVNFIQKSWEGVCGESYTASADVVSFPVEKLTVETHGLKSFYTAITVGDFITH